jgi:hypothetical protein
MARRKTDYTDQKSPEELGVYDAEGLPAAFTETRQIVHHVVDGQRIVKTSKTPDKLGNIRLGRLWRA